MKTGAKMDSEMQKIISSMEKSREMLAQSLLSDLAQISKAIEKSSLILMRPIPGEEEEAPKDDTAAESSPLASASSNAQL
ncbi:unnamed protein product [Microthlaspi erraticum]|uniref:Uncharacterized protein n=1 Tax=Microthlaspi erraticum TaxID=1685480 RepID=A0A6D2HYX7_9BRAS|nr:unnamed protein product [Microthlaspi erraticum]